MTIHKNSYKTRQEGGKLNYNFKKGREDVFLKDYHWSPFALASQNAFLLFSSGYFVPPPEF